MQQVISFLCFIVVFLGPKTRRRPRQPGPRFGQGWGEGTRPENRDVVKVWAQHLNHLVCSHQPGTSDLKQR